MLARSAGVHCSIAFGVIATIVLPATSMPMPPPMKAESASVKTAYAAARNGLSNRSA